MTPSQEINCLIPPTSPSAPSQEIDYLINLTTPTSPRAPQQEINYLTVPQDYNLRRPSKLCIEPPNENLTAQTEQNIKQNNKVPINITILRKIANPNDIQIAEALLIKEKKQTLNSQNELSERTLKVF